MISIPVAVHTDFFRWQLDLLWYSHQSVYGSKATDSIRAIIIKRDDITDQKHEELKWSTDIPHVMCEAYFDYLGETTPTNYLHKPLNIQIGLAQIIDDFADDDVIEVLDCDMFHLRPYRDLGVQHDQVIVCDVYEAWHLKSLSSNRSVIEKYFANGGRFYNGGFVPIIGRVRTFKRVLGVWIAVHRHILTQAYPERIHWWAGMYALQVACENRRVQMTAADCCYIPGSNDLADSHYICHYPTDRRFDKKRYPNIDPAGFGDNLFYRRILSWPNFLK